MYGSRTESMPFEAFLAPISLFFFGLWPVVYICCLSFVCNISQGFIDRVHYIPQDDCRSSGSGIDEVVGACSQPVARCGSNVKVDEGRGKRRRQLPKFNSKERTLAGWMKR